MQQLKQNFSQAVLSVLNEKLTYSYLKLLFTLKNKYEIKTNERNISANQFLRRYRRECAS